jgi:hypothetical protein
MLDDKGTYEIIAGLKHDKCLEGIGMVSSSIDLDSTGALVDDFIDHSSLIHMIFACMKATILLGALNNMIKDNDLIEFSKLIRLN